MWVAGKDHSSHATGPRDVFESSILYPLDSIIRNSMILFVTLFIYELVMILFVYGFSFHGYII